MVRRFFDLKQLKKQQKGLTKQQIIGMVSAGIAIAAGIVTINRYFLAREPLLTKAPQSPVGFSLLPLVNIFTVIIGCLFVTAVIVLYRQLRYSEALLQERERLQALIHHAPVAMALFNREGHTLIHSDCWLAEVKFLGESIGYSPSCVPYHWKDAHEQAIRGKVTNCAEDPILLDNGTNHWLKWTMQPWVQEGQICGSVLFMQPIDQLVEARETALETARLKSQFLANMSHEIRTPMVGVLGSAELLLGDSLPPEQRQFVQIIHSNSQHLLKVINDVLDFSKLEAGKLDLEYQWFDLDRCIDEVTQVMEHQAFEKLIELTVDAKGTVPNRLRGDIYRLKQVLFNLMGNAVKFTPLRGKVNLIVSADTTQETAVLRFEVTDTGIGIAQRNHTKLFQAFSQVDASFTRQHEGTGLGLAISKQLVKQMEGRIDFKSIPGKGSSFWFTARFEVGQAEPEAPVAEIVPMNREFQPLMILLVEDNAINQFVMQHHLQRLGHRSEAANTGREALQKLSQNRFNLVLMDCQMPELDGYSTTRIIRRSLTYDSLPIIALTAHALSEERQRCLDAGMNDYLSKPVSQVELSQMLQRWGRRATAPLHRDGSLPIDVGQLLESFQEQETVLLIVQKFVTIARQEVAVLDRALTQRDWQAVARFSHRFRGACVVVKSASLTRLTAQLEGLAKQPRPIFVRGRILLEKCRQEILRIESWVQSTSP